MTSSDRIGSFSLVVGGLQLGCMWFRFGLISFASRLVSFGLRLAFAVRPALIGPVCNLAAAHADEGKPIDSVSLCGRRKPSQESNTFDFWFSVCV